MDDRERTRMCWRAMKRRCYVTKAADYPRYGGRGIRVCERWLESFDNFLADMGLRPAGKWTLDREDSDGHYEPGNCRWATPEMQANDPNRLAKCRAKMRAKWQEPEYREKIVSSLLGNTRTLGYRHTPEAKAKISSAARAQAAERRAAA
jgi:hypothetical protein